MGKSALDGKRLNAFRYDPDELTIIGIDTDDGPDHPLFDVTERHEIDHDMVLNIMQYGVKETVLVAKEPDDSERGYKVVVVDGRRRVLHSREAKRKMQESGEPGSIFVPVLLEKGDDDRLERVSASLNFVRKDDTVMGKADRVVRMLNRNQGDYAEVAIAIGATEKTVRNYEKLMSLSAKVKKAVDDGRISASAAAKLSGFSKEDQEKKLSELVEKAGGKRVTTRAATAAANGSSKSQAPKKRVLKKLVSAYSESESDDVPVSDDFIRGVRFAIGDLSADEIDGLKNTIESL